MAKSHWPLRRKGPPFLCLPVPIRSYLDCPSLFRFPDSSLSSVYLVLCLQSYSLKRLPCIHHLFFLLKLLSVPTDIFTGCLVKSKFHSLALKALCSLDSSFSSCSRCSLLCLSHSNMYLCVLRGWGLYPHFPSLLRPGLSGAHLFFTLAPPQPSSAAPACCKVSPSEFLLDFSSDCIISCAFMCQPSCKLPQGKGPSLMSSTVLFIRPFKNRDRENELHNGLKWSEVKSLSCVWLFAMPWTVAYWAPPSMGFSRQEYWSELPFPSPGELPNPGIEPRSPAL